MASKYTYQDAEGVGGFLVVKQGTAIGYVRKTGKPSEKWTALEMNMNPLGEYDSQDAAADALDKTARFQ